VEEADDAANGNVKFLSGDSAAAKTKVRANDGWEMPSSDEEEEEGKNEEEEGEESEEEDIPEEYQTYRKEDRHASKQTRKQEETSKRKAVADAKAGRVKGKEKFADKGWKVQQPAPVPTQMAPKQKTGQPLPAEGDLNIDEI
jgi:hypothetical protein